VTLGYAPPSPESFTVVQAFSEASEGKMTPQSYKSEEGIITGHLQPFLGTAKLADMRRADVQRYITKRSTDDAGGGFDRERVERAEAFVGARCGMGTNSR
jgi:integrase-like protein